MSHLISVKNSKQKKQVTLILRISVKSLRMSLTTVYLKILKHLMKLQIKKKKIHQILSKTRLLM